MASNSRSEQAKMEQIITEFFAKSLHIILESRCPYLSSRNYSGDQVHSGPSPSSSPSSSSNFKPRSKWFNLELRDCSAAFENIDFWRQSNLEPMIVDIVLVQRHSSPKSGYSQNYYGFTNDEVCDAKNVKIIERWVLQYETKRNYGNGGGSSGCKRSTCPNSQTFYKKSILILRSLYATVRLLPAYRLFRDLVSSAKIRFYNLFHRISSFVEPFTLGEEADMQRFTFAPVETSYGRLCLSVLYNSSVLDVNSEPSTPISPQFIPEYVGSPLAEPLKTFTSLPISRSSPSSSPFGRRHSWSFDFYRASSPSLTPPFSSSKPNSHFPCKILRGPLTDQEPANRLENPLCDKHSPSSMSPSPSVSSSPLTSSPCDKLCSIPSEPNRTSLSKPLPHLAINKVKNEHEKNMLIHKQAPRSSSRLFSENEYDESVFSGAFIIDDVDDLMNPGTRSGSEPIAKKSNDAAAVGALLQMLKKAPHLSSPEIHNCLLKNATKLNESPTIQQQYNSPSGKTTADALLELLEYSKMKQKLLEQGKSSDS